MELSLSNVINISVSAAPLGLSNYNTSNLAIFTDDVAGEDFGDLGYKIYLDPGEIATDFGSSSDVYKMALAVFSQQPNILAPGGYLVVIPLLEDEALADAINRTKDLIQYFGIMSSNIELQADMLDAAAVVQTLNKIAFFAQRAEASVAEGGALDLLRSGGYSNSRGLFYGSDNDLDALKFQAAYAGRALSVIFSGSNTTSTMHLKDLSTIQPDPSMTQTLLNLCVAAGADTYPSLQGVAKVFTSGENKYFDQVYNLQWLVGALQIAGFNYLAESSTKIPQTENGMDGLKGAYRNICEQAVSNQYVAPGVWNSPTTFGNQADMLSNIAQRGYYIYSIPVALQSQADRADRIAPLVQIAIKEAGAIQSSTVVVYVNA